MNTVNRNIVVFVLLILITAAGNIHPYTNSGDTFVNKVFSRLISSIDKHGLKLKYEFKPVVKIDKSNQFNAYATFEDDKYSVIITSRMLDSVIKTNENGLAFILGHELTHIIKGHVDRIIKIDGLPDDFLLKNAFMRQDEYEADIEGLKLALKAGYSQKQLIQFIKDFRKNLGDYTPIEAVGTDHPSWTERLAYIDDKNKDLWESMSAFSNGVYFLFIEQYMAAELCFEKVTKEFPECYEAYANLGYAQLMRYFDRFNIEDLKPYNIGQIVVGAFYRRPVSLEGPRGIDEDLWWRAVGNFQRALVINPDLSLVKSNLGLAYLLDPRNKLIDKAARFFEEALEGIDKDTTLDPILKTIVYLNSGSIFLAQSKYEEAGSTFRVTEKFLTTLNSKFSSDTYRGSSNTKLSMKLINQALTLNNILVKSQKSMNRDDTKASILSLEKYMRETSPSSIWWEYCYELYSDLCWKSSVEPEAKEKLSKNSSKILPPIRSVTTKEGVNLFISQKTSEAHKSMGDFVVIPIVPERKINKYIYLNGMIEIIGDEKIYAIIIKDQEILKGFEEKVPGMKKYNLFEINIRKKDLLKRIDNAELTYEWLSTEDSETTYLYCKQLGITYMISNNEINGILISELAIR